VAHVTSTVKMPHDAMATPGEREGDEVHEGGEVDLTPWKGSGLNQRKTGLLKSAPAVAGEISQQV